MMILAGIDPDADPDVDPDLDPGAIETGNLKH